MKFPKYILPLSLVGSTVGFVVIVKNYVIGPKYEGNERIAGRTVVITGTTSGLGRELAGELANRGGRIIMGCRNLDKCEKVRQEIIDVTYNKNVHCRKVDMASLKSIREFAEDINKNEKRVDILINNAGVMLMKKEHTEDGFEKHLGVNYLGPYLLTNLLLDKLKASSPSRIINMGSMGYQSSMLDFTDFNMASSFHYKEAYMRSKLALTMFSYRLAQQLKGTGVSTYVAHPGVTRTELGRQMPMNTNILSRTILAPMWWLLLKTPKQGIQTPLYVALSPELEDHSGYIYKNLQEIELEGFGTSHVAQERLEAISRVWTHLS